MSTLFNRINLKLYAPDGGGDGAGAAPAAGTPGGQVGTAAENAPLAREEAPVYKKRKDDPYANVRFGKQQQQTEQTQPAPEQTAPGQKQSEPEETLDEILKRSPALKKQYEDKFKAGMAERFKSQEAAEKARKPIDATLRKIARRYGALNEDGSIDAEKLKTGYDADEHFVEEAAIRNGVSNETQRMLDEEAEARFEAEQQNKALEAELRQMREAEDFERWMNQIRAQEQELQAVYPDFSFDNEMKGNKTFYALIQAGVGMRSAYEAANHQKLMEAQRNQIMPAAYNKGAEAAAARFRDNQTRPVENGAGQTTSSGIITKSDPRTFKLKDFEEIQRRVARGEKISF